MQRSKIAVASLAVVFLLPLVWAVERPFDSGRILGIEGKTQSRILYYLVNIPITQDDRYYEVTVQVKDTIYVSRYTPLHAQQMLPADWQPQGTILARVEKHYLFLKQSGEPELKLVIVKRMAATAAVSTPAPATVKP